MRNETKEKRKYHPQLVKRDVKGQQNKVREIEKVKTYSTKRIPDAALYVTSN